MNFESMNLFNASMLQCYNALIQNIALFIHYIQNSNYQYFKLKQIFYSIVKLFYAHIYYFI